MGYLRNALSELAYAAASSLGEKVLPKDVLEALLQKRIDAACPDLSKILKCLGKSSERGRSLQIALAIVLEEVAQGGTTGSELKHAYEFLGKSLRLSDTEIGELKQTVSIARRQEVDLKRALQSLKKLLPQDEAINFYAGMIYLEFDQNPEQEQLLEQIATELRVPEESRAEVRAYFQSLRKDSSRDDAGSRIKERVQEMKDPLLTALKLLDCDRSSSKAQIREKYRKLILENHPDRLLARRAKPKEIDLAREKMLQISQAYDLLKRHWDQLRS